MGILDGVGGKGDGSEREACQRACGPQSLEKFCLSGERRAPLALDLIAMYELCTVVSPKHSENADRNCRRLDLIFFLARMNCE